MIILCLMVCLTKKRLMRAFLMNLGKKTVDNEKDQDPDIVDLEDLNYDDEPIGGRLTAGVAKILKKRK